MGSKSITAADYTLECAPGPDGGLGVRRYRAVVNARALKPIRFGPQSLTRPLPAFLSLLHFSLPSVKWG